LVSKNRLSAIGLFPIKSESPGERFLERSQSREGSLTALVALNLEYALSGHNNLDFIT
jgi:hypothetical protein